VTQSIAVEQIVRGKERRRWVGVLSPLRALFRVRLAGIGLVVLLLLIAMALFASVIARISPTEQDYGTVLQGPSRTHLMGTDELGRDLFSRLVYGSRISLQVGLIAVGLAACAGIVLGLLAGYWGGWVDEILMRIVDALYAFPALMLALAVTAALGASTRNAMIAIGIVGIPVFARLVRGQTLSVREQDYVTASRVVGARPLRLMLRHILPNVTAPLIVQASLSVSHAIITEASLSFLGVGTQPPTPTWGGMMRTGFDYLNSALWISFFPGVAIFIVVRGMNLLGDGLRVVFDPRLRDRGTA
jgi:peptide/nickel transport system permease protein